MSKTKNPHPTQSERKQVTLFPEQVKVILRDLDRVNRARPVGKKEITMSAHMQNALIFYHANKGGLTPLPTYADIMQKAWGVTMPESEDE